MELKKYVDHYKKAIKFCISHFTMIELDFKLQENISKNHFYVHGTPWIAWSINFWTLLILKCTKFLLNHTQKLENVEKQDIDFDKCEKLPSWRYWFLLIPHVIGKHSKFQTHVKECQTRKLELFISYDS